MADIDIINQIKTDVVISQASITRPNNTTAYATARTVGSATTGIMEFTGVARVNGGSFVIEEAIINDEVSSFAGSVAFSLILFASAPPDQADQTNWLPSAAVQESIRGVLGASNWSNVQGSAF